MGWKNFIRYLYFSIKNDLLTPIFITIIPGFTFYCHRLISKMKYQGPPTDPVNKH